MVTGGNVTGLTDALESLGLVERITAMDDRRACRVALTKKGARLFEKIASVHEAWVVSIFAGMGADQIAQLHELLGKLRVQLTDLQSSAA